MTRSRNQYYLFDDAIEWKSLQRDYFIKIYETYNFFWFYPDLLHIFVKKNYQWRKNIFREVPLIKMVSIRSVEFIRETWYSLHIYISVSRIVFSTRKKGKAYVFLRIFFVASVDHRVCFRHETMIDTCTWTSNVRTR